MTITILPIDKLRLNGGTQPRAVIDAAVVKDYSEDMIGGSEFPPVIVYHDGAEYWVADGFHRIGAAHHAGLKEIGCELRQGTVEDAQWYSYGANQGHGFRRTNVDKQRAVEAALKHPKAAGLSDREIARHVGVSAEMVGQQRVLCQPLTASPVRTVVRKGVAHRSTTAKIGKTGESRRLVPLSAAVSRHHAVGTDDGSPHRHDSGEVFPSSSPEPPESADQAEPVAAFFGALDVITNLSLDARLMVTAILERGQGVGIREMVAARDYIAMVITYAKNEQRLKGIA